MSLSQSEESATRGGISTLDDAYDEVSNCKAAVEATRHTVETHYQGVDGKAFSDLLLKWEGHTDTILVNLDRMIDELNESLREHGLAQMTAGDGVQAQSVVSDGVFDDLMG